MPSTETVSLPFTDRLGSVERPAWAVVAHRDDLVAAGYSCSAWETRDGKFLLEQGPKLFTVETSLPV